jgi:glycine/D-amino acid oxidase-like deaminating enzyme
VKVLGGQRVETIRYRPDGGFMLNTSVAQFDAARVVLSAGLGNARLAPQVGLSTPVRPNRGQILITERVERFLHYPTPYVRQTDNGSLQLGDPLFSGVGRPQTGAFMGRITRDESRWFSDLRSIQNMSGCFRGDVP